jgi:hypothetical protein
MCFETTKSAKAKIADKDIECWKAVEIVNGQVISACQNYLYKKGIAQPTVQIEKSFMWDEYEISYGYHSCRTLKEANTWLIGTNGLSIHKFIIPKGTRYYSNRTEYVSETIILID